MRLLALDGIRALAIWVILAGHLHLASNGIEILGNYIFFIISGFCIAAPWEEKTEGKFASVKYWIRFLWTRFIRIMPTYLIAVGLWCFVCPEINVWDQVLFVRPKGIAWFIEYLMFCYLFTPLIMYVIFCLKGFGFNYGMISGILLLAGELFLQFVDLASLSGGELLASCGVPLFFGG